MHIAIAGNIGSGKSTLTGMLARHYGWEARYEAVADNPYLQDYYRDIKRWSFNLEVYFLKERFRDLIAISQADHTVVQDRTIFEGVYVFMENNRDMGNLSERDYEQTMQLEYLENLNRRYDDFIYNRYKGRVITIDKDSLDFKHRPRDFAQIVDRIDQTLFGLFPVTPNQQI